MKDKEQAMLPIKNSDKAIAGRQFFSTVRTHYVLILQLLSAFFMLWLSLLLIYGIASVAMDEFYRFIFFLRHPIVVILNYFTLLLSLVHTTSWFNAISNTMSLTRTTAIFIILLCWLVTMLVSFFSISAILN